jgi:hypothetical protein
VVAANKMWTVMINPSKHEHEQCWCMENQKPRYPEPTEGHGPRPHAVDPVEELE